MQIYDCGYGSHYLRIMGLRDDQLSYEGALRGCQPWIARALSTEPWISWQTASIRQAQGMSCPLSDTPGVYHPRQLWRIRLFRSGLQCWPSLLCLTDTVWRMSPGDGGRRVAASQALDRSSLTALTAVRAAKTSRQQTTTQGNQAGRDTWQLCFPV